MHFRYPIAVAFGIALFGSHARADTISQVDPATLSASNTAVTFDTPNYYYQDSGLYENGLVYQGFSGVEFGTDFVGQQVTYSLSSGFVMLSSTINLQVQAGPYLRLETGPQEGQGINADPQQLAVGITAQASTLSPSPGYSYGSNFLVGIGPLALSSLNPNATWVGDNWPAQGAFGEGTIAAEFVNGSGLPTGVSEVGFSIVGADGGSATVDFFDASGNSLGDFLLASLADGPVAFESLDDDIAGFTIWNTDPDGIGIDDVQFNSPGGSGAVPEPASLVLFGSALFGLAAVHRRKRKPERAVGNATLGVMRA
jgi:hypothetical protein